MFAPFLLSLFVPASLWLTSREFVEGVWDNALTGSPRAVYVFLVETNLRAINSPAGWWYCTQVFGVAICMTIFIASEARRFRISRLWVASLLVLATTTMSVSAVFPVIVFVWQHARSRWFHDSKTKGSSSSSSTTSTSASATTALGVPLSPHWTGVALFPALAATLGAVAFMTRHASGPPSVGFQVVLALIKLAPLVPALLCTCGGDYADVEPHVTSAADSGAIQLTRRSRLRRSPPLTASATRATMFYGTCAVVFWLVHMHTILAVLGEVHHFFPTAFTTEQFSSFNGIAEFVFMYWRTLYTRAFANLADADTPTMHFAQAAVGWDLVLLYAEACVFFVAYADDACAGVAFVLITVCWLPLHVAFPFFLIFMVWKEHSRFAPPQAKASTSADNQDEDKRD